MDVSLELSGLWESFGELCEEFARDSHSLTERIQRHPQFWTWLTVWFGLVWISMRWSRIVADRNDRRIFETAEARLSTFVVEGDDVTSSAIDNSVTPEAEAVVPGANLPHWHDSGEEATRTHKRTRTSHVER